MRGIRRIVVGRFAAAGVAVAFILGILGLATPANATGPGSYQFSETNGATFQLLTSGNLVNGTADDVVYYLSTTSTGLNHLPFPIKVWSGTFKKIGISTNGNVQFGVSPGTPGSTQYSNDCLPTTSLVNTPVVMPFWDDLFFDSNDTSHGFTEGVFVKTKGSAPHRKFIVSWQGHHFNASSQLVQAQVVFNEGSPNFTFVYGLSGGDSATIGTQAANGAAFRQYACNTGSTNTVFSGEKLSWLHSS